MKLAISSLAWQPEEDLAVSRALNGQAVTGVELVPAKLWPDWQPLGEACQEVQDWWSIRGARIVSLQSILFGKADLLLFGTPASRAALRDHLVTVLAIANRLGAGCIVFGSPKNRLTGGLKAEAALDIAVPFFSELGDRAEEFGVDFCFEPNPPHYGTDFIRDTEEAVELARRVAHPRFRLNLDFGTLQLNVEPVEQSVARMAGYIGHCHISEPDLAPVPASDGADTRARHQQFAAALRGIGYDGWVSIEMKNGPGSNLPAIEHALEFCRDIYCAN